MKNCLALMDKNCWTHSRELIYDHLDELEKLWNSHSKDFELIKEWMELPLGKALSSQMEADSLMARMANRLEYLKTTEIAFFFIGHFREMQEQVKILRNFIDETCASLYYKVEEEKNPHEYSRDMTFKRPLSIFDEVDPDDFDLVRKRYQPINLHQYSSIIETLTHCMHGFYMVLKRLTSYILEAKEDIEKSDEEFDIEWDIEVFQFSKLYVQKRNNLINQIPPSIKSSGQEACLQWIKNIELVRKYLEYHLVVDAEETTPELKIILIKRLNSLILKAISSGPAEWAEFLSYLSLYYEIQNGTFIKEDNQYPLVEEMEASIHPELQKKIYESYLKMHPEENTARQGTHDHFPPLLSETQGDLLYKFLIKEAFIDAVTDRASFLYIMGCTTEQPDDVQRIKWSKNKQQLRELLELAYEPLLKKKSFRHADIKRLVPLCFEKDGESYRLANRTKHSSIESDKISVFFATDMRGF